jgi:hypothetical protein
MGVETMSFSAFRNSPNTGLDLMSLKDCAAVACLVLAARLFANGNTAASGDQNLPVKLNTDSVVMDARPTLASQECLLFQSTLQEGRTGIQETEWNNSFSVESASNQEGILYVSESGTGVMLSLGMFAIIHLVRMSNLHRE